MRSARFIATLAVLASLTSGCSFTKIAKVQSTQQPPIEAVEPAGAVQLPEVKGNFAELKKAMLEPSKVRYDIRLIADTGGKDATAAFEELEAKVGKLEPNVMLIVIFPGLNHDTRFALGADFNAKQVTAEDVLALVRSDYLPEARKDDPANGLAKLIRSINSRMN